MLPIDFLPEARLDFDESFDWYAERSVEAASRFAMAHAKRRHGYWRVRD
jgi:plasmid stabilization system protein ParE